MKLLINGEERSFGDDLTLAALVEQLGVKADRVAVELNHIIVRRDAWARPSCVMETAWKSCTLSAAAFSR